jgi:hypothetical protein
VQDSIALLTEKDFTFFTAEYQRAWNALPESLTMAGRR